MSNEASRGDSLLVHGNGKAEPHKVKSVGIAVIQGKNASFFCTLPLLTGIDVWMTNER